jgi:hypothetical protein
MTRIRPRPHGGVYLGGFRFIEIEKDKEHENEYT